MYQTDGYIAYQYQTDRYSLPECIRQTVIKSTWVKQTDGYIACQYQTDRYTALPEYGWGVSSRFAAHQHFLVFGVQGVDDIIGLLDEHGPVHVALYRKREDSRRRSLSHRDNRRLYKEHALRSILEPLWSDQTWEVKTGTCTDVGIDILHILHLILTMNIFIIKFVGEGKALVKSSSAKCIYISETGISLKNLPKIGVP